MRFYIPIRQLLFIVLFFSLSTSINAQYISQYDDNLKRKSAYDIKAEEARNKQNKTYKPSSPPVNTPSRSNDPVVRTKSESPDYGKYDFRTPPDENGLQIVRLNDKWGCISGPDKLVLPLIYEKVIYRGKGWYEIIYGTKSGLANKQGNVVIPCQFSLIYNVFDGNGLAKVVKYGEAYFINEKGEAVAEANQKYVYHGYLENNPEGLKLVSLRDLKGVMKYGFLDSTGKIQIPLIYDNANNIDQGLALVKKDIKWGAINKNGEVIIPVIYEKIAYLDNVFSISYDGKVGVINRAGKIIIPLIYEKCGFSFGEGCISMESLKGWGFVDSISGREIVPFKYFSVGNFSEGMARVAKKENPNFVTYGFVNKSGVEVITFAYQEARGFYGGLSGVMQNNKWGFIDQQQNTIVQFIYDDIRNFSEGLAAVKSNGKWGYINRTGKLVIPFKYDGTYAIFNEGQISVKTGEKWGSINNKGEETIAPLYNDPFRFINGEAYVRVGVESLFINEKGIIIATQQVINNKLIRLPIRQTVKPATSSFRAYETVKIGRDFWTNANLDESVFRNGDAITEAITSVEWARAALLHTPAWCYLNYDSANGKKYGKLYNWYAVNDSRGLAPVGMHIPTDAEWTKMTKGLDPKKDGGDKLKHSTGWGRYVHKNETGFSGLPGGYINENGQFLESGDMGYWWSSTERDIQFSNVRGLISYASYVHVGWQDKRNGLSVRCIKD